MNVSLPECRGLSEVAEIPLAARAVRYRRGRWDLALRMIFAARSICWSRGSVVIAAARLKPMAPRRPLHPRGGQGGWFRLLRLGIFCAPPAT
jgi:hypothetical protein